MQRIVYCVPSLRLGGGYEKVITYKANYFADIVGEDVTIVAYNQQSHHTAFKLSDRVKLVLSSPADYFRDCAPIDILISTYPVDARLLCKVKCAKLKIRELHCSVERYSWYAGKNPLRKLYAEIQKRQEIRLSRRYDYTVLLTDQERELFWRNERNVKVIPNPLTLPAHSLSDLTEKRVIAVGRISYQKGFERLVEAWAAIESKFPDWRLDIIGSKEDSVEVLKLKAAIQRCNVANVRLLPPTQDIAKEYAKSSLLVMTSRYEGFGLVLTEAMACGLPCVAFDCHCGPSDIISDGVDGLLVEQGNIEGLANAMSRLMGNPQELTAMGANAKVKSLRYDLPAVMRSWETLFTIPNEC